MKLYGYLLLLYIKQLLDYIFTVHWKNSHGILGIGGCHPMAQVSFADEVSVHALHEGSLVGWCHLW